MKTTRQRIIALAHEIRDLQHAQAKATDTDTVNAIARDIIEREAEIRAVAGEKVA